MRSSCSSAPRIRRTSSARSSTGTSNGSAIPHCAVIIAEDITSRFLNVISLFNGTIPLIAIQMQALHIGENLTLVFTTVMDELSRGLVDEDEDAAAAPTDRAYWEKRASKGTVGLADELLQVLTEFDPSLELKCNKFYIGLSRDGQPFNFVEFKPQKNLLKLGIGAATNDDHDAKIDDVGFDAMTMTSGGDTTASV